MKKSKKIRTIYYSDELNDDFAGTNIKKKTINANYKYIHKNPIWKFFSFLIYYCLAVPLVSFYMKCILRVKFVNKKALKKIKKPCFLYGNHTNYIDAFIPNYLTLPHRNKLIVSAETVSIKSLKTIIEMLGTIAVPTELSGMKNFRNAINYYFEKGYNITVYPEAHIWPYYTKIRDFKSTSFKYPINLKAPIIAFFTAYSKPKGLFKHFRKANITVYISEPITYNEELPLKDAQEEVKSKVYNFMKNCSEKYSTYEAIKYVKKDNKTK